MKANTICSLLFYLACGVTGAVMSSAGWTITNWRYWVILACIIVAHVTGRVMEDKR